MGVTNSAESQTIIHGLTKAQLQHELASRGIFNDGNKTQQQGYLAKEICGKPALRYNNPMGKLQGLGLQDYEILPTELLHDIGPHIENIFTELPSYLSAPEAEAMEDSIKLCLGNKDSKRTADNRSALIKTTGVWICSVIRVLCQINDKLSYTHW